MRTVVRIWRAPKGTDARYVTVTETGRLIYAYSRLSDIRLFYKFQIACGTVGLKRELDREYVPSRRN